MSPSKILTDADKQQLQNALSQITIAKNEVDLALRAHPEGDPARPRFLDLQQKLLERETQIRRIAATYFQNT